jgi:uroporphyrinogen-III decarboxylase
MNSRERLLRALDGQIPDRVPISTYELVGYNSQAWENNDPSYAKLMETIRQHTDCICMWEPVPLAGSRTDSAAEPARALSSTLFVESAYPVDVQVEEWREDEATITRKTVRTPKGNLAQTTKVMDGVHTVWQPEHWCKSIDDVNRALSIPYQPADWDCSDLARIREEVGERGIIMTTIADPLWLAADLMEFGEYTIWAMTETDHFGQTVAILHERVMENLRRMLDTCVVDLYRIAGPEYATPPFLPPSFFERFVVPYVSEMVDLIHSRGAKVRFHCHGNTRQVLDMILATGADGLDPCEAPPDGDITLAEIKKQAGDRICIFGNLQVKLLERGTGDEVENAVKDCMASAKEGGGYVIMPTAAPFSSPLPEKTRENYMRYIEAAQEYGQY